MTMELCCCCDQRQEHRQVQKLTLKLDHRYGYGASVFVKTQVLLIKLHILYMLDNMAEDQGYRGCIDWFLCTVYPQYIGECFQYYKDGRFNFKRLHTVRTINRVDKGLHMFVTSLDTVAKMKLSKDMKRLIKEHLKIVNAIREEYKRREMNSRWI